VYPLMARGVSTKLLATLPDGYSSSWMKRIDKRTKSARAVLNRIADLESDAGGADGISHAKRALIRRAAFIEAVCEGHELRLLKGEEIDVGALTQATNTLLGIYRMLGIDRRLKTVRSLRDVMRDTEAA
jgi:hypothetical protein